MRTTLYIDGRDAWSDYRVCLAEGAYAALLSPPSLKDPESTDWPEEDGEEFDLNTPVLDKRTVNLPLCVLNKSYIEDLLYDLADGASHHFSVPSLSRSWYFRLSKVSKLETSMGIGSLTLSLVEDQPSAYEGDIPDETPARITQRGYVIDEVDLSQYGFVVLEGTADSIMAHADTKDNLAVSSSTINGQVYDNYLVSFKTREITLKLFAHRIGVAEFNQRFNALMATLTSAGEHTFECPEIDPAIVFYYNSATVKDFTIMDDGNVWCEIHVKITATSSRPATRHRILGDEDSNAIAIGDNLILVRVLRNAL